MTDYDSTADTLAHINMVQKLLEVCIGNLTIRGLSHDASKLAEPEKSGYDLLGKLLHNTPYATPEYFAVMNDPRIKGAIEHHVKNNSHHPDAHKDGVNGMTLLDVIEMYCDWKAASLRGGGMTFEKGLLSNFDRFDIDEQLAQIFENTRKELDW